MREEKNTNLNQSEDPAKKNPLPELNSFDEQQPDMAAPPDIVIEN